MHRQQPDGPLHCPLHPHPHRGSAGEPAVAVWLRPRPQASGGTSCPHVSLGYLCLHEHCYSVVMDHHDNMTYTKLHPPTRNPNQLSNLEGVPLRKYKVYHIYMGYSLESYTVIRVISLVRNGKRWRFIFLKEIFIQVI